MKKKILLDIDGVIADFYTGFGGYLNQSFGTNIQLATEPPAYNIQDWGHDLPKETVNKAIEPWILQNGYLKMDIYPGARSFVLELMDKYDVHIVTARIGDFKSSFGPDIMNKIRVDTYSWFRKHKIPTDKLFFEHEKTLFCKLHNISLIVEDKLSNATDAALNGIQAILISRGWNQNILYGDYDNLSTVDSFNDALEVIEEKLR